MPKIERELKCILSVSVCFMLLFAADYTMVNMQKIVMSSIADDEPGFEIDGYTMIGVSYTVFAFSIWFGPYLNYAIGSKLTMIIASLGYLCHVGSYVTENKYAIYSGAVVGGMMAGILWPAQGHYMIENSSPKTTGRDVGIFWFILMSSTMIGNLFVYFTFYGKKYINQTTRRTAVYFLVAINILAIIAFMLLPKSISRQEVKNYGLVRTVKKSLSLLLLPKMRWLILTCCYAGLQQSFWNGIYSPSIGFTLGFGDSAKGLVALSGIFMSIGALMGAFCPIVFSVWIRSHRHARRFIVLFGIIAQLFTYLIAFINLPDNAVFGNTDQISIINPNAPLAMLGSLLLCFGDSCLTTQIYSIIGETYRESSAEAVSLYKFIKGMLGGASYYCCSHLGLHTQVTIMAAGAVVGVFSFFVADHGNISYKSSQEEDSKQTRSEGYEFSSVE